MLFFSESLIFIYFSSKDVSLPVQMQRAMAAEAEATRDARAKVIIAEGEMKASKALKEASDIVENSPSALQVCNLTKSVSTIFESV